MSDINSIYNKPLIWQTNIDTDNAPFIPYLEQMERVPKCLTIVTLQSMNLNEGVEIVSPDNLIEVDSEDELNNGDNKYLVLHERGQIKFSKNLEGQMIYIKFKGDGAMYMSADRIWTKLDNNGNVLETMQDVVVTVRDGVELFKNATDLVSLDTDIKLDIENAKNIENEVNNSIVLATQSNNTLKTTTDNAKAEDVIVNKTIDTAKATNTTLNTTNTTANSTNNTLNGTIATGNQLNTDLTALNTTALETKGLLDTSKVNADVSKVALDTSKTNADASKTALDSSISSGNTLKTNLENDIASGNTLKSGLEADISSGNTLKTNLETASTNASTIKSGLDGSISTGNTLKSGLQTTITDANTAKNDLNSAIASSDIAGMQSSINGIKNGTVDITYNGVNTVDKTVDGALNELLNYIGTVANLTTVNKVSLVNALNELNPAGKVEWFARNTPPTGYLKCNGASVSRTTYARLFSSIGTIFGTGDGSTTFNLPDLRGVVIRGWDDGRGLDVGRAFGSYQNDDIKAHTHNAKVSGLPAVGGTGSGVNVGASGSTSYGVSGTISGIDIESTGGGETRMKNVALLPCIRY